MPTYFDIPYQDRGIAKRAGATFDEEWHLWRIDGDVPATLRRYPRGTLDDAICVGLYGGRSIFDKSRAFKPYIARAVICPEADVCPLYAQGVCLSVRDTNLRAKCPQARCTAITQNKKDHGFVDRICAHPAYDALRSPNELYFAYVGASDAYLRLKFVELLFDPDRKTEDSYEKSSGALHVRRATCDPDIVLQCSDSPFAAHDAHLPRERVTPELLDEISKMRPRGWLNRRVIKEYADVVVPRLLDDIRRCDPDLFDRYERLFGKVDIPDAVGRLAYVSTCVTGATWQTKSGTLTLTEVKDDDGNVVEKELVSDNWSDLFPDIPGMRKISGARLSIPLTSDMTIKISDMSQVDENTTFA